jgi:hypothetical protein
MGNRQPAGISKPTLKNEALGFITGQQVTSQQGVDKDKTIEAAQGGSKAGKVPQNDVRLTANIRADLHLKLKIEAANKRTTIGELLEKLIETL